MALFRPVYPTISPSISRPSIGVGQESFYDPYKKNNTYESRMNAMRQLLENQGDLTKYISGVDNIDNMYNIIGTEKQSRFNRQPNRVVRNKALEAYTTGAVY